MTDPPDPTSGGGILTNTQRLRSHLTEGGLAAALLTAWEDGEQTQAQERMLATLHAFHEPKQASDDQTAA